MGLIDDIGAGPVGLDTSVFIYFIEEHPAYLRVVQPVFEAIDREEIQAITSALSLLETLVMPYRYGNALLARQYESLFANSRGLELVELDRNILRAAAQLRAVTGMKTPDALQIVASMSLGAAAFVTNDRRIPAVEGVRVLNLSDYE